MIAITAARNAARTAKRIPMVALVATLELLVLASSVVEADNMTGDVEASNCGTSLVVSIVLIIVVVADGVD